MPVVVVVVFVVVIVAASAVVILLCATVEVCFDFVGFAKLTLVTLFLLSFSLLSPVIPCTSNFLHMYGICISQTDIRRIVLSLVIIDNLAMHSFDFHSINKNYRRVIPRA